MLMEEMAKSELSKQVTPVPTNNPGPDPASPTAPTPIPIPVPDPAPHNAPTHVLALSPAPTPTPAPPGRGKPQHWHLPRGPLGEGGGAGGRWTAGQDTGAATWTYCPHHGQPPAGICRRYK